MSNIYIPNSSANLNWAQTSEVTVHRVVDFDVAGGDGRTLHTRIVPWDVPATVSDPPYNTPYQEAWARGAFDKQLKAANRVDVLMNFEHERGIGGVVGRGLELRDETDGLHGTFRMLTSQDADKALELVREDILTGMSLEARVLRSENIDGVVVRKDARLFNVALCRMPAFAGAQVLAVRQETTTDDEPPEPDPNPEPEPEKHSKLRERIVMPPPLDVERLEKFGIETVKRAFDTSPWDGSAGRWDDAESYCRSCLVDNNPEGAEKTKDQCHFPVKAPGSSDYNVNALRAVVGGRGAQANFPGAEAARARARRLLAQYNNQGNG